MLNIEKYKDKLIKLGVIDINKLAIKDGVPYRCSDDSCDDCDFKNSKNGRYIYGCSDWLFTEYKEEPEVDWSKVKVDTPILVKYFETSNKWFKRYFAKYEDGKVYAWDDGMTSWTANGEEDDITSWDYAKLAESEE